MLEKIGQDFRFAYRGLWRAKAFTAAAVITLALGIAGTAGMFALIEGVLLRPLPVHEQNQLIVAWKEERTSRSVQYPFGNTEIESVARASQLLEKAAGVTRNGVGRAVLTDHGVSGYANVADVTGGFFDVLGVQPILGRTLTVGDDKEGTEHVLVLSRGFWQRRYGSSRDVLGRRLTLNDRPFTVVGVMPRDLDYPTGVEIWIATNSVPTNGPFGDAVRREVNLIGRLRHGVTIDQARSEIVSLSQRIEADAPATARHGLVPVVRSFPDVVIGDVRPAMLAMFAAVGLVLLIASANVANLLLMRGEGRRAELAVRAALGAGRRRLVRQVLAESVILSVLAGVVGVAVTFWTLPALLSRLPDGLPRGESVRIDANVVLFSTTMAFVTALLVGVGPALWSTPADLLSQLRTGGQAVTGSRATRGRRTLVIAQVALAVTIVAAAGLLIRSVLRLQSVDLGLPADRLVMVDLHLPEAKYADRRQHAQFLDDIMAQLEAVPAISAATPVNLSPFSGQGWDLPQFTAEGQSEEKAASNPSLNIESVHLNYFETFQIPLRRGRGFTESDREETLEVAVISEDVAARIWPAEDAVGKRLKMGGPGAQGSWYTVVGVAALTRYRDVTSSRPTLYLPAAQFQMTATMLVLRTTASIDLVASLARERIGMVDRDVRVMGVEPFAGMLARPLARPRLNAFLLGVCGAVALLLSAIGLYGVMAAYVRQRDREISVRLALGATASGVRRFVLAEAVRLAGLGALIGLVGVTLGTRLLRSMLFAVDPLDPVAIAGAALLLIGVSALASYAPARRATRVDAVATLRS
jgi:putative ABC transport system permease protein